MALRIQCPVRLILNLTRIIGCMTERRPHGLRATLTIPVTTALKTQLELEAWECQMSLPEYVRGLLKRRGKWARSVGSAGGYDLMAPWPPSARSSE